MDQSPRTILSGLVAIVALLLILPQPSLAKSVAYCSRINTSDLDKMDHPWQSQGWCNTHCKDSHPLGIIQGLYCWCSDYAPIEQDDVSNCSDSCPGYPDEKCGNEDKNMFIYIRLDSEAEVKGTKGASQPTGSISSSAASTTLRTSAAPSNDPPSSAVTSVQVVTVSGVIVTQTIVTGPTAPATTQSNKKTSTGAIVGGVVGGLAVLCAIAGAVIFTLWRRRKQQQQEEGEDQSGVRRNISTMSKSGLLGSEKRPQYPPAIATNYNSRSSRILDNDSISPISASDRRSSRLVFDQRLNPSAIMVLDNPSRESFISMDDSRDYGRTLNVRNPDPDQTT